MNPKSRKQKRAVHYINISEDRVMWIYRGQANMKMIRGACIQFLLDGRSFCRTYKGISEASILRLAKIQEKLAQ